jgi:hypothetical protein
MRGRNVAEFTRKHALNGDLNNNLWSCNADCIVCVYILSCDRVTIYGVWIGNWIYRILQNVTSGYSALANSHTVQFTTARNNSSQSTASAPVIVW